MAFWSDSTKLKSYKFRVGDIIPANLQSISTMVSYVFFASFEEKKAPIKFYGVFEVMCMKMQSFE